MLDVRRLALLREVKIRGTLAEVAKALNFSPSAVSQQLSLLETEVGTELLRKVGRKVLLTPQAEILVTHATQVLEILEKAEADLAEYSATPAGQVKIAVFQSVALAFLPSVLEVVRENYPNLRLEVTQQEPEAALHATWSRDFDLVIAEEYPGHAAPRHPELDRLALASDEIRLAVPAKLESTISGIADCAELPWVMEPRGTASRHWAEQACRQAGFDPIVQFETADLQAHIRLVESGNAVALLPDLIWTDREISVSLKSLDGHPKRKVFTSTRIASAKNPAIVACRTAFLQAAAK